jgi:hypothetical protein
MNEVEPWSDRARRGIEMAWTWYTDLGQGAWLLALSVVIVAALGLAVFEGRHDSGGTPCGRAQPYVSRMERLATERHHRLTVADMAWMENASSRLTSIAQTAFGDDVAAIRVAAQTADGAQAGQRMKTGSMVGRFDAACGTE